MDTFAIAGYQSGLLVLWDLSGGSVLKQIDTIHTTTLISVRFWKKMNVVTSDAKGKVNLLEFSRSWMMYSVSY